MSNLFELRSSPIHGQGVFALRRIRTGRRLIEYTGERVTPEAADLRYDDDAMDKPHTFLFTIDAQTMEFHHDRHHGDEQQLGPGEIKHGPPLQSSLPDRSFRGSLQ